MKPFLFVPLMTTLLLAGCASTTLTKILPQSLEHDMYLRGVFNWWEADEAYKLVKIDADIYAAEVYLIADGQPYDFKIADADWSSEFNCGYRDKDDQRVELNTPVSAQCHAGSDNFQFIPGKTATYRFEVDFADIDEPSLLVTAARL